MMRDVLQRIQGTTVTVDYLGLQQRRRPDWRGFLSNILRKGTPDRTYCLGTGNSVANYIPLANYLAMVDEGILYSR